MRNYSTCFVRGVGLCIHTSFRNLYGQILQNRLYKMRSLGHYSTMQGDLFGRCPTQSDPETGEASKDPAHWVGCWCLHFDISNIFGQIRCDNTCPLQSYTPNDVIISKFEQLAKKFPQTAKMVEVGKKTNLDVKVAFRLENPHWASVSLASGSVTMSTRRESCWSQWWTDHPQKKRNKSISFFARCGFQATCTATSRWAGRCWSTLPIIFYKPGKFKYTFIQSEGRACYARKGC